MSRDVGDAEASGEARTPEDQTSVSWDFDDWFARQAGSSVIDVDIALVTVFVDVYCC
ncbi:hypothetical protein HYDPIDRAFT_116150 [Hydnomerulius pinastri MD-312]|uniref:Unplaced genomic scaffold scaffold_251, whole genome shotgun sequence n=1 Tax=Hydnomerulius pinastri MD-312 TaxID=994086 RepID=A0A0C9VX18_9AGAM|nr:hypothetical protein HYDPIDRAFT_120289 [Hydnomerulius pinastri MD-312]KIJ61182.1 hypothetical protein HYDPIDRAFT_116150 [Hydnomerulius pinastri MD-312]